MKKIAILLFVVSAFLACSAETLPVVSTAAGAPIAENADKGPPFPRLGMWWLDPTTASPSAMARYDLLLDSFEDEDQKEKLRQVRDINPNIKVLKPLSPSERALFWDEDGQLQANPEIADLPSGFFLLQVGSTLKSPVGLTDTKLKLTETMYPDGVQMFHEGGEVAIGDHESARIMDVDTANNILTVERGYVREAVSHKRGEKVASHIRFWPGSWVMNVTAACPRIQVKGVDHPVNWMEYYFALITGQTKGIYSEVWQNWDAVGTGEDYEGFVLDRFEDKESWLMWIVAEDAAVQLDLSQNNRAATAEEFDASWQAGTDLLLKMLREKYPKAIIIRNNPLTERYAPYDGQVYESGGWSTPSTEWWEALFLKRDTADYYAGVSYLQWFHGEYGKPLVMMEVYEDEGAPEADSDDSYDNPFVSPGFVPNYQRMRFSLASSLMGDGYYSYEINTDGHGSLGLMWFDEYDNGGKGKGYLGYPKGACVKQIDGVYRRQFDHGLVLLNPQSKTVTVELERPYRKIKGSQVPVINDGSSVTRVAIPAFDGLILMDVIK